MRTRPIEHELTVPAYRFDREPRCANKWCESGDTVGVHGDFCVRCICQQSQEWARVRALKSDRRPA